MSLPVELVLPKTDGSRPENDSNDPNHAYSYGGKHPDCCINNGVNSCSKNMYPGKRPDGSTWALCNWHAHSIGTIFTLPCNCPGKVNIFAGGIGAGPRGIASNYAYAQGHDTGATDFTGNYCCPNARSCDDHTYKCGKMYVCYSCQENHPHAVATHEDTEDSEESSSEESDGPVPYIPMTGHIFGIRKGNAYSVSILTEGRGHVNVKTYADAMYVHQEMLEAGDNARALCWYALASHMPDRPLHIQPLVINFE